MFMRPKPMAISREPEPVRSKDRWLQETGIEGGEYRRLESMANIRRRCTVAAAVQAVQYRLQRSRNIS